MKLALQNHGPLLGDQRDVVDMVNEVCSPVIINGEYAPIFEVDRRVKNHLEFMRKLL